MTVIIDGTNGVQSVGGSASTASFTKDGDTNNGIFFPATDVTAITTAGTERLRIDASGNAGLGVTPSAWTNTRAFDIGSFGAVSCDTATSGVLSFAYNCYAEGASTWKYKGAGAAGLYQATESHKWYTAASGTTGNAITFTQAMTLDASGNLGVGTTSPTRRLSLNEAASTQVWTGYSQNNSEKMVVGLDASGNGNFLVTANAPAIFSTNNTERARITSGGELVVGDTSVLSNSKVTIYSAGNAQIVSRNTLATAGQYWRYEVDASNDLYIINHNTAGVYIANGGTSWSAVSDERLKTNLAPIENAVEKVSTLRAVTGRYKTDEEDVSRAFLIAQDVQAVLPEAVNKKDDDIGTLGLAYTETIPLLVAAIKELKAELDAAKVKIAALEAK